MAAAGEEITVFLKTLTGQRHEVRISLIPGVRAARACVSPHRRVAASSPSRAARPFAAAAISDAYAHLSPAERARRARR
jgi:hypothetical protein